MRIAVLLNDFGRWMLLSGFLLSFTALADTAVSADAERLIQREHFQTAWRAAARSDWEAVAAAAAGLGDYPLRPWLEAERRRQEPLSVPPAEMASWLDRYVGWPFHRRLQIRWLRALGAAGNDAALLRFGAAETDPEVQCAVLLAKTRLSDGPADLADRARALWRRGVPHPAACDALWSWLQQGPGIGPDLVWERFLSAADGGQLSLAAELARDLDDTRRPWAERRLAMALRPQETLRQSRLWPADPEAGKIVEWGLKRLIHDDVDPALAVWPQVAAGPHLEAAAKARLERDLALYRALRLAPDAVTRLDQALGAAAESTADTSLLIWRTRVMLAEQNWAEAIRTIDRLPVNERSSPRWRYFRARALAVTDPPAGRQALSELAAEPNYYGFLAADRSAAPYVLCEAEAEILPAMASAVATNPLLEIAIELFYVGLTDDARAAWRGALRGAAEPARIAAAALAARHGWYESAIATLSATSGGRRFYTWRFPLAHRPAVIREATFRLLDPALVFGLIRAESAFAAQSRSRAGALGLMQLLPATARLVASRENWEAPDARTLFEPATNIRLGTAYLEELESRLQGGALWLLAAYNAGPNMVEQWRRTRSGLPGDIAIETLPYPETRDYVSNVLAYATVYDWRLNGDALPLSTRLGLADASAERRRTACETASSTVAAAFTAQ